VVTAVRAGSPAEQAGIPVGAVIVGFGGLRIDSPAALVQAVRSARVGQEVELAYHVGNRTLRTKARLAAATEPTAPLARGEPDAAAGQLPPVEAFPLPPLPLQPPTPAQPPVLDRMGRMIEGLMGPREAPAPAAEAGEVIQLRQQVEALQSEIAALKQQVAELNARLKAVEKSPE
jgi:membrane-associated protease RseP (regulator of RpoE activity)